MKTRNVVLILLLMVAIGGGICYYFYDNYKKAIAEEELRDSLRRVREAENARYAAIDAARRDSIARYERTHSQDVIRKRLESIIEEEMMSGRNRATGKNWSEDMNKLYAHCMETVQKSGADSVFQSFSFNGLMGKDVHPYSYEVRRIYYVTDAGAYADVLFDIGSDVPDGQNVIYRLRYENEQWVIDDFTFVYTEDGYRVSEKREMKWFAAKWDPDRPPQEDDIDL